jgi:hypothetical protein
MIRRALLVLLCLAAATAPASAQVPPPIDPDAPMIQAGPFGINPTLALRDFGRDENVFNERDNPRADFTFTVIPRAEIIFKPRAMRFAYTAASEYVYYQEYESERSNNFSSSVRADFTLDWFLPYVLASGITTRQRLNQEVDARARHKERVYGGGFGIRVGTRLTIGGGLRTTRLRFDEGTFRGEDLAQSFDSDTDVIEGSATMQLTTFTQASLTISNEQQRFRAAKERDSDSLRVTPTFTFSPQAVLNGSISLGYRRFTPVTAALPAYSGFVASASVGTTISNRHRVEMIFGRDIRYSYERTTPYYLATGGSVTLTSQLVGPLDLRLTGARQLLDYRSLGPAGDTNSPGDDVTGSYGGGFGYRIQERLRFGVNIEWSGRDSELSDEREYRNRRIFASFTWGKPL